MEQLIVSTENLTKTYGSRTVVDNLNLKVPEGCVYGFLGPNGSGKSTTMKMLLSLISPTSGHVQIAGQPMNRTTRRQILAGVGSLIESPPGYGHLTGWENMRIVQRLGNLSDEQVGRAVATVRMERQMGKRVREFSLGMKQRLGIAMALARQPRLLILDEPTNGLDPAGIEEIRELLRRLADSGVSVIVSSHLLGEIDRTATRLGILSNGKMLFQGTRDDLLTASSPDTLLECSNPLAAQQAIAGRAPTAIEPGRLRVRGLDRATTAHAVAAVVGAGVSLYSVQRDTQTLEDVFMDLTQGGGL